MSAVLTSLHPLTHFIPVLALSSLVLVLTFLYFAGDFTPLFTNTIKGFFALRYTTLFCSRWPEMSSTLKKCILC